MNITCKNGKVIVDGEEWGPLTRQTPALTRQTPANLNLTEDSTIQGDVKGDLHVTGENVILVIGGNVGGSITTKGRVSCGSVGGSIKADTVVAESILGSVQAVHVTCKTIKGSVISLFNSRS